MPRCSPSLTWAWISSWAVVTATLACSPWAALPATASSLRSAESTAARFPGPAISRRVRSANTRASASSADSRSGRVR